MRYVNVRSIVTEGKHVNTSAWVAIRVEGHRAIFYSFFPLPFLVLLLHRESVAWPISFSKHLYLLAKPTIMRRLQELHRIIGNRTIQ